jgi:hypothetical protein
MSITGGREFGEFEELEGNKRCEIIGVLGVRRFRIVRINKEGGTMTSL